MYTIAEDEDYLQVTEIINYDHPIIQTIADGLKALYETDISLTKAAFEFVRDEIDHSFDIDAEEVTAVASDVLLKGHGICYAKSHLLAAILRALAIPAGICYQKQTLLEDLSQSDQMCIHALNAAYLKSQNRWIRFDARGNKPGVNAQFSLDTEQLAFPIRPALGEEDYPMIYAQPLPSVIHVLQTSENCQALMRNLPTRI